MDIVALAAEITNDPLGRGYAAMSDEQAAASLNAKNRSSSKEIPAQELHAWFVFNGKWPTIETTAASTAGVGGLTANQKLAAQSFIEICRYFSELNMLNPAYLNGITFILNEFVSRGIITSEQRSQIAALATGMISRGQELGIGGVHHTDVAEARRGN